MDQGLKERREVDYELKELPPGNTVQVIDKVIYVRHAGEVSFATSLEVFQRIAADPHIPADLPVVLDLLDLILPSPTIEDVRAFVNEIGALKEQLRGRIAAVTDRSLHYGFVRMISMLMEYYGMEGAAFRDLASAERWIRGA